MSFNCSDSLHFINSFILNVYKYSAIFQLHFKLNLPCFLIFQQWRRIWLRDFSRETIWPLMTQKWPWRSAVLEVNLSIFSFYENFYEEKKFNGSVGLLVALLWWYHAVMNLMSWVVDSSEWLIIMMGLRFGFLIVPFRCSTKFPKEGFVVLASRMDWSKSNMIGNHFQLPPPTLLF